MEIQFFAYLTHLVFMAMPIILVGVLVKTGAGGYPIMCAALWASLTVAPTAIYTAKSTLLCAVLSTYKDSPATYTLGREGKCWAKSKVEDAPSLDMLETLAHYYYKDGRQPIWRSYDGAKSP